MTSEPDLRVQWRVWKVSLVGATPQVITYSNVDWTPAECESGQDADTLFVYQKNRGGTSNERIIMFESCYIHLEAVNQWSGSTPDDVAKLRAQDVVIDAVLYGVQVPEEIFQDAEALSKTDRDFPGFDELGAYGLAEEDRFDARVASVRDLPLGRKPPYLGPVGG